MTYRKALEYIHSTDWRGSRPGLSRITELCGKLGDPQDHLKFIHVAGTNGKGSVSAMTAAILRAAGYRVGLFTSPYVERFNERIMLNGRPISNDDLAKYTEIVSKAASGMEDGPTEFELITAIGLLYYRDAGADYVVLECGLGGRLDSTNVIKTPAVSVITGIDLDHTELLGDTTGKIAAEKAGIMKPGVPVVYGEVDTDAERVILSEAEKHGCAVSHPDYRDIKVLGYNGGYTVFLYKGTQYAVAFPAVYQTRNAACVIEVIGQLKKIGVSIPDSAVQKGLRSAKWKARFEILSKDPLVIYDGSHNPQGMKACVESIRSVLLPRTKDGKINILMGVMADKDYPDMIELVAPYVHAAYAVCPGTPRSLDESRLAEALGKKIRKIQAYGSPEAGVAEAVEESFCEERPLVCLGTLYMYREVKYAVRDAVKKLR